MSFVDPVFFVFLAAVALLCRVVPHARGQNLVLLLASFAFYGWREPAWLVLLGASVGVDWWAARALDGSKRRGPLWVSLGLNLGVLATFKYAGFVVDGVSSLAVAVGGPAITWRPGLPLPPGISFFTFQSMAYTIDVSRGKLRARESLIDVGAHIAAFPQLVAGPIERATDLLPQLERRRAPTADDVSTGLSLLAWGAVQKVVVADTVGLWVDAVFAEPGAPPVVVWAGVMGFMVQILGDFGGYTDMARGSARLLGLRLSANFDRPFLAASPSEFWRRWHQTFSRWMHDYVYIPLGGSRHGPVRAVLAATVSLVLAGLWHGAAWNFVAWGGWFAVVWVVWRMVGGSLSPRLRARGRPVGVVLTLGVVAVGMLLFREPSLARSLEVLSQLPWSGSATDRAVGTSTLGVALLGGAILAAGGSLMRHLSQVPGWVRGVIWAAAVLGVLVLRLDSERDFVYFQF